jgi:hypothetical protein
MAKLKTREDFINDSISLHGNSYDYSLVEYFNSRTKVSIICPTHGEFKQTPSLHLQGSGCRICANNIKSLKGRKTKQEFINESNKIHNNKYDYSLVEYINSRTKVSIICPMHGEFKQLPDSHIRKKGCFECSKQRKTNTEFINECSKIHNNKYDYSKVIYTNSNLKIHIICPTHGEFKQRASNHLRGDNCPKCYASEKTKHNFKERASIIHDNSYSYENSHYKKARLKVDITCKVHGIFSQSPDNHLRGNGCPRCTQVKTSSDSENQLNSFISEYIECESNVRILDGKEIDVYVPTLKLAFEYNGIYWHSSKFKNDSYHIDKTNLAEEKGIHLIHIYEDDWLYKNEIVKSRILNLLGKSERIYARKCIVKEVSPKDTRSFLNKNHIQGFVGSKIKLGLYHNDVLVSLMTFGSLRKNLGQKSKEGSFELLRFCNKLNTTVIGGASKLFKYFTRNYYYDSIISYADRSWSTGNLYEQLGFKYVHKTKPNFYHVKGINRYNRFTYRKDILVKDGYDPKLTAREIMLNRGFYRIYDSGSIKFIFQN